MPVTSTYDDASQVTRIKIDGRFDFSSHRDFREAYRNSPGAGSKYEIDMQGTEYIDSSALGMLLLLREHAGSEGANIVLKNTRPDVKDILLVSNFDKLFTIE